MKCKNRKLNKMFFSLIIISFFTSNFTIIAQTFNTNYIESSSSYQFVAVSADDFNEDGFLDIVSTSLKDNGEIALWLNDGSHEFNKSVIATNFLNPRSVYIEDIDGDGILDILSGEYYGNKICWWKNDGNENFNMFVVDSLFLGPHTVDAKDINGDGHMDILSSGAGLDGEYREVAWWVNDGNQNFSKIIINNEYTKSCFIEGVNMDGDSDKDILFCDEVAGDILWYENIGSDSNFVRHMIDSTYNYIHNVVARDIDNDGDKDIIGASTYNGKLTWWENDGNQEFTRNHIFNVPGAIWVDSCDVDKDGNIDLVLAAMGTRSLTWWENDGNQNFNFHILPNTVNGGGFGMVAKDFDNDDDIDFTMVTFDEGFGNNDGISELIFWENNTVDIESNYEFAITNYELNQNYPNPFNPVTRINYKFNSIPLTALQSAEIVVHNSLGQQVWSSGNLPFTNNPSKLFFDGSAFNSGIYYYSLIVDGKTIGTKSMVLIK